MSAETEGYVWKFSPYRGAFFAIHLALGDIANDTHGYELWTSAGEIAKKARTTRQTVADVLAEMAARGLLERLSPDDGKTGKPVRYRFLMPEVEASYQPRVSAQTTPRVSAQVTPGVGSDDRGGVGSDDTELKGLNSKELNPAPRPRDELFETLCELASWDFHALTKRARGTVNDVAKQLRSVGGTPEEARRRADTYRRLHPTWDFTIEALAKHWPGLNGVRPQSKTELDDEFRRIAEAAERRLAQ